ncbi:uncharacterized protein MELLADRAFT_59456 [Melampsora larici-populina 98AG31]|uniref:Secreted protein n=1 Tax=Melampsora larici-populina (strain 98AG31 / pathotype 3-4-7) TaxID=747676 RepID=F4R7J8_MELLP|nr:uncharacterized protein MELLADRAFT_59456 [Melampsora larici-populina 98AG31]EGG11773.1 hypothetical protein MELLADRAFT_59456 [Melampsora larici-populina 98AG31]
MYPSLFLFVHLAFHVLVPIFVGGEVSLLRDVLTGSDLKAPVVDLDGIVQSVPSHPPHTLNANLIGSVKPFNAGISQISMEKYQSRFVRLLMNADSPSRPVPYETFFKKAKKVEKYKTFEESIRNMASKTAKLIPKKVSSPQKLKAHLSENQDALIECFNSAKTALEEIKVQGTGRLWALGTVAGLLQHLPSDASKVISHLATDLWKDYIYLEIQAALAFEASLSHKFRSHLKKGKAFYNKNPDGRCFKRADFLARQERNMRMSGSIRSHNLEKYVVNKFLSVRIPSETEDIKKTIEEFSAIFKDVEYSIWKAEEAINIFIYLTRYWEHTMSTERILELIETNKKIYRDFYSPFARLHLKNIIENEEDPLKIKDLIPNEIKNTHLTPSPEAIQSLIKTLEDKQLMPDIEFEIYKLLMTECTLHPEVNEILIDAIQNTESLASQIQDIRKRNRYNSMIWGTDSFKFFNYINSNYLLTHKTPQTAKRVKCNLPDPEGDM